MDDDHNGWTNRASWNVSLRLTNHKETYDLASALKMTDAAQFENFCRYLWGKTSPDGDDLNEVNWQEIAESCCENEI